MTGIMNTLLRRSRATTRLEKAAGGVTQATWAIEQLAGYFEAGGTIGGLQFLIGKEGDPDEILQTYGEDPGPLPERAPADPTKRCQHLSADDGRRCNLDAGHKPLSIALDGHIYHDEKPAPLEEPRIRAYQPNGGETYQLLDSFTRRDQEGITPEHVRVYRIMNYGQILADDQEIVGTYYDEQLPDYLVRVSEVHAHDGDRQTSSELKALVVERSVLE